MAKLVIIADDFTGALDTGVQFSESAIEDNKTIYVFDAENNRDLSEIADVLKKKQKLKSIAGCAGFDC